MRTFEQIDDHTFRLSKAAWREEDRLTAVCISMTEENEYSFIGDVRIVWPEALKMFLLQVFTDIYADNKIQYKTAIFKTLNVMYKKHRSNIRNNYLSSINYTRPLYAHQLNALVDMIPHKYNFLSFTMGLGKTITSATISKVLKIRRTIIVCPASVKWNWYHDMTDDWGYDPLYWTILDSKKSKCVYAFQERFVVVNYEMVQKAWVWDRLIKSNVGHIIIDEVHLAKNHTTKRYKGVAKLVEHFNEARVTMLSGTPVTNRVNDMFAYFKLSGHTLGHNYSAFMRRYVERSGGFKGKIIGAKNLAELEVRKANFMIRKKTEECIDLPELIINKYYLDESEITDEYKKVLAEMYQNKLSQAEAQESKTINQLEGQITANVHSLNRILATAKADSIIKLIDKIKKEGRKVVVFATYKSALSALEVHYGRSCVKIDGSVDSHKRSLLINRFKTDPSCELFLGNVKAAGVGINLTNARDVIVVNFPFTVDDLEQPPKRCHRIGQVWPVNVYYIIVKKSIDEHIYNIVVDKSNDINAVLDKGKKGVVHYGNVEDKVFKALLNQYADEQGVRRIEESKFEEV